MTKSLVKTNFTTGELSYEMLGRGELRAYENGALFLRNVFISPTGGVSRRHGLRYITEIGKTARLISFAFNTEQTYLFVLTGGAAKIFKDEILVATLATPWAESELKDLRWTQSADTLLVAHPDYPLKKITRSSHTSWSIEDWSFYAKDGYIYQPHFKFGKSTTTLTLSALTGTGITVTASTDYFVQGHIGTRFKVGIGEIEITGVTSATVATADVKTALLFEAGSEPENNCTPDFYEQAFSSVRGYPVSVTFYQDRLVIGGSRELPNRLWFSRTADMADFNLGEGLDDEAIEFGLLSDQVNAIKALFSGAHLQVFTSGAEWMVSGDPLTPSNIQLRRQTRVGSPAYAYVPPRNIDGATLFCSASGTSIREYLYSYLEEGYQAADTSLLSPHLINKPIDEDYDPNQRLLFVVMSDGSLCTLTNYRSEQVSAWSKHSTAGTFLSVAVVDDDVYVMVKRGTKYFLEVFDKDCYTDSTLSGTDENGKSVWSGLSHLEGEKVAVIADNLIIEDKTVTEGEITLAVAAKKVSAGLAFTHRVTPLPPARVSQIGRASRSLRMIRGIFRILKTAALEINTGLGTRSVLPLSFGSDKFSACAPSYTKDVIVGGIGWKRDILSPLWEIESSKPAPFTLLSATTEIKESE